MSKDNQQQDPIDQTVGYYNKEADTFISNTVNLNMEDLYREFLPFIKPMGHILDAGCGSGRDSLYFINNGFQVTALDASEEMVQHASQLIAQPVLHMRFSDIEFATNFDGVWACASLLHIPKSQIDDTLFRIVRSLVSGGIFYASFKYGNDEGIRNERLFSDYTEGEINSILSHFPELTVVKMWRTQDIRPNRNTEQWLNIVCRKSY